MDSLFIYSLSPPFILSYTTNCSATFPFPVISISVQVLSSTPFPHCYLPSLSPSIDKFSNTQKGVAGKYFNSHMLLHMLSLGSLGSFVVRFLS